MVAAKEQLGLIKTDLVGKAQYKLLKIHRLHASVAAVLITLVGSGLNQHAEPSDRPRLSAASIT